jgi:hypothetical protein
MGLWDGYNQVVNLSIRFGGFGIVQARAPALAASLLALGLLIWAVARRGLPAACQWCLVFFGCTSVFVMASHNVRPEGFVFLAISANIIWIILDGGVFPGIAAGFLATAAVAFHPAAAMMFVAYPLLALWDKGPGILRARKTLWWIVGLALGGTYALFHIDPDSGMRMLGFITHAGVNVERPPLLRWTWHLWGIVRNAIRLLNPSQPPVNPCLTVLVGNLLTAFSWQIRRWAVLEPDERSWLKSTIIIVGTYVLFTASNNSSYLIYIYPWLFIQFGIVIHKIGQKKMVIDRWDSILFLGINLAVFSQIWYPLNPAQYICAFLLPFGCAALASRSRSAAIVLVVSALGMITIFHRVVWLSVTVFGSYMFKEHVNYLVFFLVWPLVTLMTVALSIGVGHDSYARAASKFRAYFISTLILSLCFDASLLKEQMQKCHLPPRVHQFVLRHAKYKRIAGPLLLWLYEPSLPLQDVEALYLAPQFGIKFNLYSALRAYTPDVVFWPIDRIGLLEQEARHTGAKPPYWRPGSVIEMCGDIYQVLHLYYHTNRTRN